MCSLLKMIPKEGFELFLEEIHHKNKKDSPSGTALRLKNHLSPHLQEKLKVASFREGEELGTHRLILSGKDEKLIIEHQALSRRVFAFGAFQSLSWLLKKPPGLYFSKEI